MSTPFCRRTRFRFGLAAAALFVSLTASPARAQVIVEETTPGASNGSTGAAHPVVHHHGRKPAPKPAKSAFVAPKLLWRTLLHRSDSTPALGGDNVYVTADADLYVLDAGGHTLGMAEIGPTQDSPLIDSNRVYVGTDRGTVYGLDRQSAKVLWKFTGATDAVLTTPAVGGGRLYVESNDNYVYGLAASTGGEIWKFLRPDGSLGYSSPVYSPADALTLASATANGQPGFVGGTDALFVCGDATLYRLDPASGHQVWHTPIGGKSLSTPALAGGRLYVGGDGSGLTALATGDGHQVWSFGGSADHDWFGAPLVADGVVYVCTADRYVYAIDAATGKQKWSARLRGPSVSAPALDARRHVLYVGSTTESEGPSLTALDARTGANLWDTAIGSLEGSPVVNGDRLYAGSAAGYFYGYALH